MLSLFLLPLPLLASALRLHRLRLTALSRLGIRVNSHDTVWRGNLLPAALAR